MAHPPFPFVFWGVFVQIRYIKLKHFLVKPNISILRKGKVTCMGCRGASKATKAPSVVGLEPQEPRGGGPVAFPGMPRMQAGVTTVMLRSSDMLPHHRGHLSSSYERGIRSENSNSSLKEPD